MKFGLIGHPIEHSLSPALFKAGYDGRYTYELIEETDFEKAYDIFLDKYDGINVTAPFKELAVRKADILSDECRIIGATNLLVKTPEGIKAYNSDYLGVLQWLESINLEMSGSVALSSARLSEKVKAARPSAGCSEAACPSGLSRRDWGAGIKPATLIVGLGGAGKAAAAAARSLGLDVTVLNRTLYDEMVRPLSCFRDEFRKADIIIYNLPVRTAEMDTLTDEDFGSGNTKHILEANYRDPAFDKALIHKMQQANPAATYTEGRIWLLLQAVTGYEILTGECPDKRAMEEIIKSK